jgi:hypothetical protein
MESGTGQRCLLSIDIIKTSAVKHGTENLTAEEVGFVWEVIFDWRDGGF